VPANRQSLLFSATMPGEIRRLADTMLKDPIFVQVDPADSTATAITQSVYHVSRNNKPVLLERLLRAGSMDRTLVFTRTKHGADKVVRVLQRGGIGAVAIHGNKSQNARTHALEGFKKGRSSVLVATDIASRGIDVDEITHVVNFDIPNLPESYVHRIGRTARAGASGIAVSFCDSDEISDLKAIERLIKQPLDVNGDHPDLTHATPTHFPTPAKTGSPRQSGGRQSFKGGYGRRRGGNAGPATASRGPRRGRSPRSGTTSR
jgi:ATP-dependent RNA helicase RhlE